MTHYKPSNKKAPLKVKMAPNESMKLKNIITISDNRNVFAF